MLRHSLLSPRSYGGVMIGLAVLFAAWAKGAHDLWAATLLQLFLLFTVTLGFLRRSDDIKTPLIGPMGGMVSVLVLSALQAHHAYPALLATRAVLAGIVMFYFAVHALEEDAALVPLVPLGFLSLIVQAIEALIRFPWSGSTWGDTAGTLINPNIQAGYCLFWVPLLGERCRLGARHSLPWRIFHVIAALSALILLVLTRSVWAWVVLGAYGVYLLIGRRSAWVAFFAVLAVLKAGVWWALREGASSVTDRLRWWEIAITMWKHHPFLGVGPGNFEAAYPVYKTGYGQGTLWAHSAPLTWLAETGLLGFISVLVLIAAGILYVARNREHVASRRPWAAGVALFFGYTLVHIGIEYQIHLIMIGLFAGACVARIPSPQRSAPRSVQLVALALAATASLFMVSSFQASRFLEDARKDLQTKRFDHVEKKLAAAMALDPLIRRDAIQLIDTALFAANTPAAITDLERLRDTLTMENR